MGRGGECRAGEIRRGEASLATSDSWHVFAFGFPSWFKNVYSYRLRQPRAWVVDLGFGGMRLGWFRFPTGCFCFCRVSKAIQRVFRLFLFWCVASKYLGFDVEQNSNDILKKGLVFA